MQIALKNGKAAWKQDWAEIGGKRRFYRSRWEYRYALYLELLKQQNHIKEWNHEPTTFYFDGIKRGTNNYRPDFSVEFPSGKVEYFEVKGYETPKDRTKYKRMAKYHPDIVLTVVGADWFKKNSPVLRKILKQW
jgi:hypothetical protein